MKVGTKEKIVGAIVVTAAVATGSSYWIGSQVEEGFRESVDWAARYGVTVSVVDYQRGFFGATARTDVVLQMASAEDPSVTEAVTVPFIHNIRHGPLRALGVSARIHSEAQLAEEGSAHLNEMFGADPFEGKAPLVAKTVVGLGGRRHSRIVSPKFEAVMNEDQTKVFWDGLNGEIDFDSSLSHKKTNIVVGGLSFMRGDEDIFQTGRITFKSDMTLVKGFERVYTSTKDFVLEKFRFQGKSDSGAIRNVEFENFRFKGGMAVKDGALNMEIEFDADKMLVEGEAKETADNLKLVFLLENIDAKAYDDILQAVLDGQEENEEAKMALLQRKPVFSVKEASGRWPEGLATGSFRIAYDGDAKDPSAVGLSGDLQLVLPRALVLRHLSSQVSVEITDSLEDGEEVNVSEETTKQVDEQMAAMLEKGIFAEKGDTLVVDAHFRSGELNINGKQQPIERLFELLPPFL